MTFMAEESILPLTIPMHRPISLGGHRCFGFEEIGEGRLVVEM